MVDQDRHARLFWRPSLIYTFFYSCYSLLLLRFIYFPSDFFFLSHPFLLLLSNILILQLQAQRYRGGDTLGTRVHAPPGAYIATQTIAYTHTNTHVRPGANTCHVSQTGLILCLSVGCKRDQASIGRITFLCVVLNFTS